MNHTEVPLNRATRLINHGPTVMISSYDLDKDLTVFMTAQWVTPLDSVCKELSTFPLHHIRL